MLLGVLDQPIGGHDPCHFTTSKIGGRPDLIGQDIPIPCCSNCGHQMVLVLQIYCPLEGSVYHRSLYIFACVQAGCRIQAQCWKVLRCQTKDTSETSQTTRSSSADDWGTNCDDWGEETESMATDDTKYSAMATSDWCSEADDWGDDGMESGHSRNTVMKPDQVQEDRSECDKSAVAVATTGYQDKAACGQGDANIAGQMSQMFITDVDEEDDKEGTTGVCVPEDSNIDLRQSCLPQLMMRTDDWSKEKARLTDIVFDSFYISVIEEDISDSGMHHERALLEDYARRENINFDVLMEGPSRKSKGSDGGNEGYEKGVARHGDQVFQKFLKRVTHCPQQIIRYKWNGQPLWITAPGKTKAPACPHCGSLRHFEMQVMPALVQMLKVKGQAENILEFGTILVYSCQKSCWTESDICREEWVLFQGDPDEHLFKAK